jgi:S-adenosyl-L-methionine hydrolase (adenosine-forming)
VASVGASETISFISDYGLEDEFVGVVHRVIARVNPNALVIDINHQIPAQDVPAAGLALWRCAPWLAPGVILGVVDPGVGTPRRAVAIEVNGSRTVFVGPDNGMLFPGAARLGVLTRAVELEADEGVLTAAVAAGFALPSPAGATFAGRDVFAPAAALLAAGAPLQSLGSEVDVSTLVGHTIPRPEAREERGVRRVRTEVLWVDHFGNAQLNAGPDDVAELGLSPVVRIGDRAWPARVVTAYGQLQPGELGLVVDSYGLLSISLNAGSGAQLTGVVRGSEVHLVAAH